MNPIIKQIGKVSLTPKGDYKENEKYEILDIVNKNSKTYIAIQDVPENIDIENIEYWMTIATGPSGTIEDASAEVDDKVGTPSVELILEGTPQNRILKFVFKNLKGTPGKDFTYDDFTDEQIKALRIGLGSKYLIGPNDGTWAEIFNDYSRNTSKASHSHVEGLDNNIESSGIAAHVEGFSNECSGHHSHVEGNNNSVSGQDSHAEGVNNVVSSNYSHAECYENQVSAPNAHAEGYKNLAAGNSAHVEGKNNTADGVASHCGGENNKARTYCETVIGCFNEYPQYPNQTIKEYSNNIFTIGNGNSDDDRNNCFKIKFNGDVYTDGQINSPAADYAEMFEWLDGNEANEDRVGYFVTLIGDKIIKATSDSKFILGIVSANPSVIGNNPMKWKNKYLTDDWGRTIYETVEVSKTIETVNENGEKIYTIEKHFEEQPKLNPEYNNDEIYKLRTDRKEWDAIGMLGALRVRQDGTLSVGEYCNITDTGIATKSESGYYVTRIINENIAEIIFK